MASGEAERSLPTDSLWRDRSFQLFWFGRNISLAGTAITTVVLPILVFRLSGSALQTALLGALQVVPYIVFGLAAGALADRVDRRRLMVACDLINMALLGSIPLAAALNALTLPHIYLVALLSSTAFVWFDAANFGALPTLVGRKHIVAANSTLWSASTIVNIIGPSLGGALAALAGPAPTISINALTYLASAISLYVIPRPFNLPKGSEGAHAAHSMRDDIRQGLQFLWRQRLVRTLTLLGFGNSFAGGAVTGLLVVYAVRALGLAADDGRIGLLFTAGALGSLVSGLALPRLTRRVAVGRITLAAMWLAVPLLLLMTLTSDFATGLLAFGLWEACYSLIIINGIVLRQVVTPEHLQGRVNTTARMIAWGGTPFGAAIGGALAEWTDVRTAFLAMALVLVVSATLGWFSPLREASDMTLAAPAIEHL